MEVSAQADDPLQLLLIEIDALGVTTEISDQPPSRRTARRVATQRSPVVKAD
jgi:hypothetical protein